MSSKNPNGFGSGCNGVPAGAFHRKGPEIFSNDQNGFVRLEPRWVCRRRQQLVDVGHEYKRELGIWRQRSQRNGSHGAYKQTYIDARSRRAFHQQFRDQWDHNNACHDRLRKAEIKLQQSAGGGDVFELSGTRLTEVFWFLAGILAVVRKRHP